VDPARVAVGEAATTRTIGVKVGVGISVVRPDAGRLQARIRITARQSKAIFRFFIGSPF
jgi:hypothetical protein